MVGGTDEERTGGGVRVNRKDEAFGDWWTTWGIGLGGVDHGVWGGPVMVVRSDA